MESREFITIILLVLLIICAVSVNFTKNLLQSVIIFMAYSSIMAVVWVLLESPDLAITEAAVGCGVSGTLFLVTLRKIWREDKIDEADIREAQEVAEELKMNASPTTDTEDRSDGSMQKKGTQDAGITVDHASEAKTDRGTSECTDKETECRKDSRLQSQKPGGKERV